MKAPAEAGDAAPGWVATPPGLARMACERLAAHLPPGAALFDPTCGEGALLLAAVEVLGARSPAAALHGVELDPARASIARRRLELAVAALAPRPAIEVRAADALAPRPAWPRRAAVLANPPWVSLSGRQADRSRARELPARPGWPSLHGAFLERIARHVARSGLPAAVLAPAAVVELERYAPLRRAVDAHARLLEAPLELGERAFPGVQGAAVLLLLGPLQQAIGPPGAPWTGIEASCADLLRLLEPFPRLPAGSFADPGVHSGNAAGQLIADEPGPGRAPVRRGRDLAPYVLGEASQWLRTDLEPGGALRFRRGSFERYVGFPILLRQTADRPVAALHRPPGYFRNSLLAGREPTGLDPAVVVALLNGPLAAFWHRARHRDARQRAFPQVKVGHLATQPLPFVERRAAPELHDELARRVRALDPARAGFDEAVRVIEERALTAFGLPPAAIAAMRSWTPAAPGSPWESSRP